MNTEATTLRDPARGADDIGFSSTKSTKECGEDLGAAHSVQDFIECSGFCRPQIKAFMKTATTEKYDGTGTGAHGIRFAAISLIIGPEKACEMVQSRLNDTALYVALMLSFSLSMMVSPPESLAGMDPTKDWQLGVYIVSLSLSNALFLLTMLWAMQWSRRMSNIVRDSDRFLCMAYAGSFFCKTSVATLWTGLLTLMVAWVAAAEPIYGIWFAALPPAFIAVSFLAIDIMMQASMFGLHDEEQYYFHWNNQKGCDAHCDQPNHLPLIAEYERRCAISERMQNSLTEVTQRASKA